MSSAALFNRAPRTSYRSDGHHSIHLYDTPFFLFNFLLHSRSHAHLVFTLFNPCCTYHWRKMSQDHGYYTNQYYTNYNNGYNGYTQQTTGQAYSRGENQNGEESYAENSYNGSDNPYNTNSVSTDPRGKIPNLVSISHPEHIWI